jgi:hypothetical protein
VEADEAHHVAFRRVGRVVPRRRHDPLRRLALLVRRQLAGGDQVVEGQPVHRRPLPCVRVEDREGRKRRLDKR